MKVVIAEPRKAVTVNKETKTKEKSVLAAAAQERLAIGTVTRGKVSLAYRRAVATNAPVVYISRGSVIKDHNGKKTVIGKVKPLAFKVVEK